MYYACDKCVHFSIQMFTSHQGGVSPIATTHITYPARNTHEPGKLGQVVSCYWPKLYIHTVGRLLHQQLKQHSISFSIKCHSPIFGKESYSQRALMDSKISLIFSALQLGQSSLGGGPQLKIDGEVFQQRQDSNKFTSPLPLDIHQHEANSTGFQLLALVVITAQTVGVKLHIPDNSYQSIWRSDQCYATCVGILTCLGSIQKC